MTVPDQFRDAQRPTRVTRSGLDPQSFERPFPQQPPVPHAVQRHATRETQVVEPGLAVDGARHAQHHFLAYDLNRAREVHLALRQLALRYAGRTAEQAIERAVRHREAGEIVEVLLVKRERAVFPQVDELGEDHVDVLRLAVRREPHHLVLARIHLEAGVIRERGVQEAQRVGPMELLQDLDVAPAAHPVRRGCPLPYPIRAAWHWL